MTEVTDNGTFYSIECGNNIAFVFNSPADFNLNEYSILRNADMECFLHCCKTLYNGNLEVFYLTEDYSPLRSISKKMNAEDIISVFKNIVRQIKNIEDYGCLSLENILASPDTIFVDKSDWSVKLIYLPLVNKYYKSGADFIASIRNSIHCVISDIQSASTKLSGFDAALMNKDIRLSDIASGNYSSSRQEPATKTDNTEKTIKIIGLNSPEEFSLEVNKNNYVIGRSKNYADGVVPYNNYIGKRHCIIIKTSDTFSIVDLESANKTYVNGKMIQPNTPVFLNNGDKIRLANSDFKISIT